MNGRELAADTDDGSSQLLQTALFGEDLNSQRTAVRRLREAPIPERARSILIAAASSDDLFVRRRVAVILAHCPGYPTDVLPALLLLLNDSAWSVREAAANGLANRIREQGPELTEAFPHIHGAMVSRSIRDGHHLVRDAAIRALTEYEDPVPTIRELLEALQGAKPVVRCRIYAALEHFEASVDLFRDVMIAALDDSDRRVRRTVADIFTRIIGDPTRAIPALTKRRFDRHGPVREAATLATIRHRRNLPRKLQIILRPIESEDRPQRILNEILLREPLPEAVVEAFIALCRRRIEWWRIRRTEFNINLQGSETADQLATRLANSVGNAAAQESESAWLLARLVELLVGPQVSS